MKPIHLLIIVKCFLLLIVLFFPGCQRKVSSRFTLVPSSDSGINFSNLVKEDTVFNIIEYLYFYNGGGVCAGDINNDGLVDLYFTANQQQNRLFLNKGNFSFEDISQKAGVAGIGNWKTGATFADVNNDGYLDIYLCGVGNYKSFNSQNQLLINNHDLTFTDKTDEFGLAFKGFSTQAAFFDYDLDGDLDVYLLNHSVHSVRSIGNSTERAKSDSMAGDRFFRNELIHSGNKTDQVRFKDITREVGISSGRLGYGLGIAVSDLNLDGYPDLYISNDFQENDFLYLNQRNGTFRQILEKSVGHSSRFSMGNDVADYNNDLRPDICTLDMLPREESIIKTSAGDDPYEIYKYKLKSGFHYQTARNCLQFNRLVTDSSVLYSDISILAGVEATDWSWSPLFVDFDNDGFKDLFISNGIQRRPNDMDYVSFISNEVVQRNLQVMNKEDLSVIDQMPTGKVSNHVFKNNGDLTFSDVTTSWGLSLPSLSNGAAYADLDNDGDQDLITNNLNEAAFVYRNNSNRQHASLKVFLQGKENKFGVGAKVIAYVNNQTQFYEVGTSRGFQSVSDMRPTIGLAKSTHVDSLLIIWPSGMYQKLEHVSGAVTLTVKESDATQPLNYQSRFRSKPLLHEVSKKSVPDFCHRENEYNAFNYENLMPHMLTTEGPAMAVGDVNGDHLDDIFIGGGKGQSGALFIQLKDNSGFFKTNQKSFLSDSLSEDVDAAFFDADGDGDLDLAVVSGGQELSADRESLKPRLYLNDGKANYVRKELASFRINASCVKHCDFDLDGDIDLFVGASAMPMLYGMSPPSFLMVNDGSGNFKPNPNFAPGATFDNVPPNRPGMVKDATWNDINQDGLPDLVLVGEWMPVTILIQQANHEFINQTKQFGLEHTRGWWNSISASDLNGDGKADFVLGNLGLNSRLKATVEKPLRMILGDLDGNGMSDHILIYFNGDKSYPFASRDQLTKQLPYLKKKFLKYADYRNVVVEDIISPAQAAQTTELKIEEMRSCVLISKENAFVLSPLPTQSQFAPVAAALVDDVDHDGKPDILLGGNLLAVQTELGPYDASLGLVLKGDGKGNFTAMDAQQSGFVVQGEVRGIQVVRTSLNGSIYVVTRNNASVIGFEHPKE